MNYLRNIFYLIRISVKLYGGSRDDRHTHRQVKKIAKEEIGISHQLNDGSITAKTFSKIQWYMVSNLLFGELLCGLISHKITERDRKSFVLLGACMGLFDAALDDYRADEKNLMALLHDPEAQAKTAVEKILVMYWKSLLQNTGSDKHNYFVEHYSLIESQLQSNLQTKLKMREDEIHTLTMQKGGASVVLFSGILTDLSDETKKALYHLGGFIQFMNDAQDLYKDYRDGVLTFVNFKQSFSEIIRELELKKSETFGFLKQLQLAENKKRFFIFCYHSMYTGIVYKLKCFAEKCGDRIDYQVISSMKEEDFRINMFSTKSIRFCYRHIVSFDYQKSDKNISIKYF